MRRCGRFRLRLIGLALLGLVTTACAEPLEQLELPDGFSISIYARNVGNARQLALSPDGTLFVGSRRAGRVYALRDLDNDGYAETQHVVAQDLFMPSGVAFRAGDLYVAEVNRVLRFPAIEDRLSSPGAPEIVYDQLPDKKHHGWKFIAFGPDGRLYVPVGAPCNVCAPDPPFAGLLSMTADGGDVRMFARGIRNTVGFDWRPGTTELWFGDNGRDWLGDDRPPCELNRAPTAGLHFGFPYVHGQDIADPEFDDRGQGQTFVPPALALGAHVAPLGLEFYRGEQFPPGYQGALFVAEHGSWNRSRKSGYRVMMAKLSETGEVLSYEPFITGWKQGESNWGRPVDFAMTADGALLISDDQADQIYRVTYRSP